MEDGRIPVIGDAAIRGVCTCLSPLTSICSVHNLSNLMKRTLEVKLPEFSVTASYH